MNDKPIATQGDAVGNVIPTNQEPQLDTVKGNKSFILHPLASQASGPLSYPIA